VTMAERPVRHIVIAGGGPVAATAAAAIAISLRGSGTALSLVETPAFAAEPCHAIAVGGETALHTLLGVDEALLLRNSGGRYGLGTRYRGYRADGRDAFVPSGGHGMTIRLVDFHQCAARLRAQGDDTEFNAYSLPAALAARGRFMPRPQADTPVTKTLEYVLYVDAERYTAGMRNEAAATGVDLFDGDIETVDVGNDGCLSAVILADGTRLEGDFFIDCSAEGKLIGNLEDRGAVGDWSSWLPCDRIARLLAPRGAETSCFATIDVREYGWLESVPLADSMSLALTYSSERIPDDEACAIVAGVVPAAKPADIRIAPFRPGKRSLHWTGNCVAIGAAAATFEPWDFPRLRLEQNTILRLLGMLPRTATHPRLAEAFNRETEEEYASARDYQLLRYALCRRGASPRQEPFVADNLPASLRGRIELYEGSGRFTVGDHDCFSKAEWVSSFINLGSWPASYDPIADAIDADRLNADVARFRDDVRAAADTMG